MLCIWTPTRSSGTRSAKQKKNFPFRALRRLQTPRCPIFAQKQNAPGNIEKKCHGNQLLQLDPEKKPSPLGGKVAANAVSRRMRGNSPQAAAILRPHQSPAVTASPVRGKPSFGKPIPMKKCPLFLHFGARYGIFYTGKHFRSGKHFVIFAALA